jgi:hypothetical protein
MVRTGVKFSSVSIVVRGVVGGVVGGVVVLGWTTELRRYIMIQAMLTKPIRTKIITSSTGADMIFFIF